MTITFACPDCGIRYNVADENAGRNASCKKCKAPFTVPAAAPPPFSFEPHHLHCAAEQGDLDRVKKLIAAGADVNWHWKGANQNGPYDDMALHFAAQPIRSGNREDFCAIVELLLSNGAHRNARNVYQQTPLHVAVINGEAEIAKALLDGGAKPNTADDEGTTILESVDVTRLIQKNRDRKALRKLLQSYDAPVAAEWRHWGATSAELRCPFCEAQSDFEMGFASFAMPSGGDRLAAMKRARAMAQAPQNRKCAACGKQFEAKWTQDMDAGSDLFEWRPPSENGK